MSRPPAAPSSSVSRARSCPASPRSRPRSAEPRSALAAHRVGRRECLAIIEEAGMTELKGKIAWLTGAGTGIGLSGAEELAAAGAHVILSGRRADKLEEGVASIKRAGGSAEL